MKKFKLILFSIFALGLAAQAQNIEGKYAREVDVKTNWIKDGNAEVYTKGFATYNDGAVSLPVDGTGGTATGVTFAKSTSTALGGKYNFLLSKDASNRQGTGFSYDFAVDAAYSKDPQKISFKFLTASGTFVPTADVKIYVYDKTNSKFIALSRNDLRSDTDGNYVEYFQGSGATSYRLIGHIASTSASAYTVRFDDFTVSPNRLISTRQATDTVSFTPTYLNAVTFNTGGGYIAPTGKYYIDGEYAYVSYSVRNGAGAAASGSSYFAVVVPPAILALVDTNKLVHNVGGFRVDGVCQYRSSTSVASGVYFDGSNLYCIDGANNDYRTTTNIVAAGTLAFTAKIPIINSNLYSLPQDQYDYSGRPCTASSNWTNTTVSCKESRKGAIATWDLRVNVIGAAAGGNLSVTLPRNMDIAKFSGAELNTGTASVVDAGTAIYTGVTRYGSANSIGVAVQAIGGTGSSFVVWSPVTSTNPVTFVSGDYIQFTVTAPVEGWIETQGNLGIQGTSYVNSTTTKPGVVWREEYFMSDSSDCTSSPCASLDKSDGSSSTRSATGTYSYQFGKPYRAGTFPICTASNFRGQSGHQCNTSSNSISNTSIGVFCTLSNSSGTAVDSRFVIWCKGQD